MVKWKNKKHKSNLSPSFPSFHAQKTSDRSDPDSASSTKTKTQWDQGARTVVQHVQGCANIPFPSETCKKGFPSPPLSDRAVDQTWHVQGDSSEIPSDPFSSSMVPHGFCVKRRDAIAAISFPLALRGWKHIWPWCSGELGILLWVNLLLLQWTQPLYKRVVFILKAFLAH